ncbi:MAG TPA: hypothetical protein VLF91_00440 [Candidatus Saccharimonadales bacterium]|nr:hypothetical protein [Candidatus Saccharimonadales bacterium]
MTEGLHDYLGPDPFVVGLATSAAMYKTVEHIADSGDAEVVPQAALRTGSGPPNNTNGLPDYDEEGLRPSPWLQEDAEDLTPI